MQLNQVLDPRITNGYVSWKAYTRKQMEHILKLEKMPYQDGMTHDEMTIMADARGLDARKYVDIIFRGALHGSGEDRAKNLEAQIDRKEVEIVIQDVKYEEMKMFELRQECNLQAIPWKKTDKKVQLIAKLKAKQNDNAASGR